MKFNLDGMDGGLGAIVGWMGVYFRYKSRWFCNLSLDREVELDLNVEEFGLVYWS